MAISKLFPEFRSNSSVQFAPKRTFISSSYGGVTGSINVIVNRSNTQKDSIDMREGLTNQEGPQKFDENTFEGRRKQIYEGKKTPVGSGEIFSESTSSYNYDLQLALLLDGANPTDSDADGYYDDYLNFPPEYFKKEYTQLNLNYAYKGYSDLPMHPRNAATCSIHRFVPGTDFIDKKYRRKEIVRTILDGAYKVGRPNLGWGYTNFHCINLFESNYRDELSGNLTPNMSSIVYNSPSNRYLPTTEVQIEFFLKMARQPTSAGTILHLPGAFAISVVTGSDNGNLETSGLPKNYRLMLQLGSTASGSQLPDNQDLTVENNSRGSHLTYLSKDFITASYWHHCCVRYSPIANNNTGSFLIDGKSAGFFEPPATFTMNSMEQDVNCLFMGSFYTGTNSNATSFFNTTTAYSQGVEETTVASTHPAGSFVSGLDAEIHEVKIANKIRSRGWVRQNMKISTGSSDELLFHVPVLYTPDSPKNNYNALVGDLMDSETSSTDSTTLVEFYENIPVPNRTNFDSPFNTHHANIGGFLNINAQAYLKDFVSSKYPYLHNLSSSVRPYSSCHEMSSSHGYSRFPRHMHRNLLILPCDNGTMKRTYGVYSASLDFSGSVITSDRPEVCKVSNLGNFNDNFDSKLCMVDEGWNYSNVDIIDDPNTSGPTPLQNTSAMAIAPAKSQGFLPSTIPSTKYFDPDSYGIISDGERSSSMVAFFNIPTLFYGNKIKEGSLEIVSELYVTGSERRVETKLIDDGYGNLIRSNASGSIALNNFVGTVYYEDGIVAIKSPHLYMFGENHFEMSFKGEQNMHMFELLVPCSKTLLNSSSNPNYQKYAPSNLVNETAEEFVFLSGVNFHDENMNVVAKARFSQPIVKRIEDEFLVRVKIDY